ncbi:hypothetical protein ACFVYA_37735 [Amycolatopsis sp. NPDC058278]|uniref:hypothetical protein n=1 Tax=Amycolatopsis sp. NPDC058278 TaxID=3346417 RepID=UPI0036D783E7
MQTNPAQPRTILAVDVEGSTLRTNTAKARYRRVMYEFLDTTLAEVGIDERARENFIDCGDGALVLIRPVDHAPKTVLLDTVLPRLSALLCAFALSEPEHRFRLRSVLHAGEVHFDDRGCYGTPVDLAFRLLNAVGTKRQLIVADVPLVVVTSDHIYDNVVRHNYPGIDPAAFVPSVRTRVAGRNHRGWTWHVPPLVKPSGVCCTSR